MPHSLRERLSGRCGAITLHDGERSGDLLTLALMVQGQVRGVWASSK